MTYAQQGLALPPIRVANLAPVPASKPEPGKLSRIHRQGVSTTALTGPIALVTGGGGNYFEGLNSGQDRTPIPILTDESRLWLGSLGRERLAGIANYLYDNVGLVAYAVDKYADYCVPMAPQAATDDDELNKEYEEIFRTWGLNCDHSGRFTLGQIQKLLQSKCMLTDGDCLTVAVEDGGEVRLVLAPYGRVRSPDKASKNWIDGVFLEGGKVAGYNVFSADRKTSEIVPASMAFLHVDPVKFSDFRGFTALRRGLNDARDIGDLKSLEKLNQKIRASLPAVIEGTDVVDPDKWGEETENAPNPDTATPHEMKLALGDLIGGDVPTLPPGQKLNVLSNTRDPSPVTEFMTALAAHFCFGLGLPPAFILDEKLTGPNIRSVNGKAQRTFDAHKEHHKRFLQWAWTRVIGHAIAAGRVRSHPRWNVITYQSQAALTIDTGDDASADREDLKNGYRSRQEIAGKRGADWQTVELQISRELDFIVADCKALAAKHPEVPLAFFLKARGLDISIMTEIAKAAAKPTSDTSNP